jgi:multisubunit Na+/H+ antiporter MnhB subunit
MKRPLALILILLITLLIGALLAGPHSCQGGLQGYLFYGLATTIGSVLIIALTRQLPKSRKLPYAFLTIAVFIVVWIAGIFLGDFNIVCRLF